MLCVCVRRCLPQGLLQIFETVGRRLKCFLHSADSNTVFLRLSLRFDLDLWLNTLVTEGKHIHNERGHKECCQLQAFGTAACCRPGHLRVQDRDNHEMGGGRQ